MSRLLIVSNRLPVSVSSERDGVTITPSSGGLATGLRGPHQRSDSLWLGWPGEIPHAGPKIAEEVERRLAEHRAVPVMLNQVQVTRFYHGFSNGVLWPLYHYLIDKLPRDLGKDWPLYVEVNQLFADAVVGHYRPGDMIWIHDYQLSLVPGMVRRMVPEAKIGFFLHIPFPSSEVFRILPWRSEVLEGMLGADLIGFHTYPYLRHFHRSLDLVLGLEVKEKKVRYESREIQLGTYPMGIDEEAFSSLASSPEVGEAVKVILRDLNGKKLVLGVDRLDYTKGLVRRMDAIGVLLRREPSLRGAFRFVQVAVPSRTKMESYATVRRQFDELVGRINGEFGSLGSMPVHYLFRSISKEELVALYRAADVMVVTPLRDGMNLVAKEFVASRPDGDGVLVLSELAGAANELVESLRVNPYDIEAMASAIRAALTMPEDERRGRMKALRKRVRAFDSFRWAQTFQKDLSQAKTGAAPFTTATSEGQLRALAQRLRAVQHLLLMLDYDGTLMPFASTPLMAYPDSELVTLLSALSARKRMEVHLISGRSRETMGAWFGALKVGLHAEHGFWSRMRAGGEWQAALDSSPAWKDRVLSVLESFSARTPGALIEEKSSAFAWHYRMADPELGALNSKALTKELERTLAGLPAEVIHGAKVLEVRTRGIHKGLAAAHILRNGPRGATALAMGDDRTDEDLFAALPAGSVTFHVGTGRSLAKFRLADPAAARDFLKGLLE